MKKFLSLILGLLFTTNLYAADMNRTSDTNKVSTVNSTTSTLTANSSFTGTWEEVLDYAYITIMIRSDVVSATDGLDIQWSADGSTAVDDDKFTISANNGKVYTFGPQSKYFRVVYTNGGTNQSSFTLQTIFKRTTQKASSHRIGDMLSDEDDVEVVKAVIAGSDGQGNLRNVSTDTSGRLLVSENAATPADTTEVINVARSSTNSTSGLDTTYTITNGKTLVMQTFSAGSQSDNTAGSVVDLYEDPNGDLSVLNLISVIYINGNSTQNTLSTEFTGNGTRRIVMRRRSLGGSSREIFGRWKGFERS